MKIRVRTLCAGPDGVAHPGQVVDWPAEVAGPLVLGGYAEVLDDKPARIETTEALPAPEHAVTRHARRRGGGAVHG